MIKYLAFFNNNQTIGWPSKVVEIDAENVHVAYESIQDKENLAFITISEEDPLYPWPEGEVYSKYYLENPEAYNDLGELPF
jgi:hypothetical protein